MKKAALFAVSLLMAGIMTVSPLCVMASSKSAASAAESTAKTDSKTDSKKTDSKTDSKKTDTKTDSKTESKATESKKADTPADPTINVENQAFWRESLQKYRHDDNVHQIMLVRCTEGCKATVQ